MLLLFNEKHENIKLLSILRGSGASAQLFHGRARGRRASNQLSAGVGAPPVLAARLLRCVRSWGSWLEAGPQVFFT